MKQTRFQQALPDFPVLNQALLEEALTHPSAREGGGDNQRLEFLGDAVVQLVVSEEIYKIYPSDDEGIMTKRRASLVSREAMARVGSELRLEHYLRIGPEADRMGARTLPSTLADAFEALAGAIYLDGGLEVAREFLLPLFAKKMEEMELALLEQGNPRSRLQEILQTIAPESPMYECVSSSGPSHAPVFVVRVTWGGLILGEGSGMGKKVAYRAAAADALERGVWLSR